MLKWQKKHIKKRKSFLSCSPETLIGGAILISVSVGATAAIFTYQDSGEKKPPAQENFLARATTPAYSQVYHVKKAERDGKDLTLLVKMGKEGNLNSNENHPTKRSRIIAGTE